MTIDVVSYDFFRLKNETFINSVFTLPPFSIVSVSLAQQLNKHREGGEIGRMPIGVLNVSNSKRCMLSC